MNKALKILGYAVGVIQVIFGFLIATNSDFIFVVLFVGTGVLLFLLAHSVSQNSQKEKELTEELKEITEEPKELPDQVNVSNYDFVAIDFETATSFMGSACAVGIVAVKDFKPVKDFYSLIRPPENRFDDRNISIHGISPEMTASAPTLTELWPEIEKYFDVHTPVVAYNAQFDMSVLRMSTDLELPDFVYVDAMALASYFVEGRKSLVECCSELKIDISGYEHHNAKDDAKLCAYSTALCLRMLKCNSMWEYLARSGDGPWKPLSELNPTKYLGGAKQRWAQSEKNTPKIDTSAVATDGPLAGKCIAFTGELSIDRSSAEQLAISAGAIVKTSVSKKISYLVVGEHIYTDGGKSGKEKKAEELNSSGAADIKILNEQEFMVMLKKAGT